MFHPAKLKTGQNNKIVLGKRICNAGILFKPMERCHHLPEDNIQLSYFLRIGLPVISSMVRPSRVYSRRSNFPATNENRYVLRGSVGAKQTVLRSSVTVSLRMYVLETAFQSAGSSSCKVNSAFKLGCSKQGNTYGHGREPAMCRGIRRSGSVTDCRR